MKILFTADWHIKLGQDKVPKEFQKNRFMMLSERLHQLFIEHECDLHISGGDIFDVAKPSTEEIELLFAMLKVMDHKGMMYTGNHEMLSKTISCLDHLSDPITRATKDNWEVVHDYRSKDFDIIPYSSLHSKTWKPSESSICFTHVRGTITPHVTPEIELTKFIDHGYNRIFAGDLHSFQNSQEIVENISIMYPGSPLTTSFHRKRTVKTNGAMVIDTKTGRYSWIELGDLPQLIRKTITVGEEMIPDSHDRVIYEVEGDVSQLKAIKNSELLDKRLNTKVLKDAKLDLADKSIVEELETYLKDIQNLDQSTISRLKDVATKYVKRKD
ncbi:putative recombination endonuclease [Erwinia phage KEY]|uniref:Recombination endonuclease n=2 Tax=Keyvirus TaxID=3152642 RepID=A0AAE7WAW9_9CAUD|nr:recombination-related endonuclease [Pantoea phage vB_PagS_AAS21]QYC51517.1 putative recombination endonuclease [Erwinia phage KEY]